MLKVDTACAVVVVSFVLHESKELLEIDHAAVACHECALWSLALLDASNTGLPK